MIQLSLDRPWRGARLQSTGWSRVVPCCLLTLWLVVPTIAQDADSPAPRGAQGDAAEAEVIPDNAAVRAIRDTNPTTPAEQLRAIDLLMRLDRQDVAREYVAALVARGMDVPTLASLQREFGTALLLRLARDEQLAPEGAQLAQSILQAAHQLAHDAAELSQQAQNLAATDRNIARSAALELVRGESDSVGPLMQTILETNDDAHRRLAIETLTALGETAVDPLLALLAGPNERARATAIAALGRLRARRALPSLAAPLNGYESTPGEREAAAWALQQITGRLPATEELTDLVEQAAAEAYQQSGTRGSFDERSVVMWTWDETTDGLASQAALASDAAAVTATRLYHDLHRLRPNDLVAKRRWLISFLHVDQALGGLDEPLRRGAGTAFELASQSGPNELHDALVTSLREGRWEAAQGVIEVLREHAEFEVGDESLVDALDAPDRRVRFGAAEALVKRHPDFAVLGAGRLVTTLEYFAAANGSRSAVVAHPRTDVAQTLAGILNTLGFNSIAVTNGKALMKAAVQSPDVELLLVSDRLADLTTWARLEEIRADPRTRFIPVGLVADAATFNDAERIAAAHQRVVALPIALDQETFATQLPRLLPLWGRDLVHVDLRSEQAVQAQAWLDAALNTEDRDARTEDLDTVDAEPLAIEHD